MGKLYRDTNLQILSGVILMLVLGVSSIMPVLPKLMETMNIPARSIGLVISAFTFPAIVIAPVAGFLADRFGRKRILTVSLLIFGIFGACCVFAWDFRSLLVFRFFQGLGVGPLGVLYATIIGDLYGDDERTHALAICAMVLSCGTAFFPVIGGGLAMLGVRYPFILPAVAVPLAFLVSRYLDNPEPSERQSLDEYIQGAVTVIRSPKVAGLLLITLLTSSLMFGPFITYLPVLMSDKFAPPPALIGLVLSFSSLFTALAASQIGRMLTRWSEITLLRMGFVLYIVCMAMIPFMPTLWSFILPVSIFGAAMGLNAPVRISLLSGLPTMETRAAVMAVNAVMLRLGQTLSPILMGLIVVSFGIETVYAAGCAIGIGLLALAFKLLK